MSCRVSIKSIKIIEYHNFLFQVMPETHKMVQFVPQLIKWQTMNSGEKFVSLMQDRSHSLAWGEMASLNFEKKKKINSIYIAT